VVQVGSTQVRYALRAIEDPHAMQTQHGDWLPLGGLRGWFGVYLPPVLEALGLAEVEHQPKNNRMRAVARK
jgi:hypothetical protein